MARVYLPDGSKKIVVPDASVNEYLAQGYLTQAAYKELAEAEAARAWEEWIADPATEAERFIMLRKHRDARISMTDYLMASDYPISEERRSQVKAYRQALRDLPAQPGAPWDGGGENTPWPEKPATVKA